MAVKVLGQFAQPQASPTSGLSEAIGKGLEIGETKKRTNVMQQDANTREQDLVIRAKDSVNKAQQLKIQLAREERDIEDRNLKRAEGIRERISTSLIGKTDAERSMIVDSDSIKELVKTGVKPYMPDAVDSNGSLIPIDFKWVPTTEEEQLAFKEKTAAITAKIKAGAPESLSDLSFRERSIILAKATSMISPEEAKAQLARIAELRKKLEEKDILKHEPKDDGNALTGALGQGQSGGEGIQGLMSQWQ